LAWTDQVPRGWSSRTRHQSRRERISPLALKNALFAGHEVGAENWALLASVVATCKLIEVNPVAYIPDTRQANGHPQSRIDELMPWKLPESLSPKPSGIGEALTPIPSA